MVLHTYGFDNWISLLPDRNDTYCTAWLDRDDPTGDGDYETYDAFVNTDNSVSQMNHCGICMLITEMNWKLAGVKVSVNSRTGLQLNK
jgi:hypothetical protein